VLTLGAPVVLVVIFGYIFGSAIAVPGGGDYRAYLVSGLFATIAANVLPSMVARDSTRGVVDRFRSLPITRSAVPFGQAAATAVYGLASFVLMGLHLPGPGHRQGGDGGAGVHPGLSHRRRLAARAPRGRLTGLDRAAAGRLRPPLHRPLRPPRLTGD
jgi:ABC-2 type transporter